MDKIQKETLSQLVRQAIEEAELKYSTYKNIKTESPALQEFLVQIRKDKIKEKKYLNQIHQELTGERYIKDENNTTISNTIGKISYIIKEEIETISMYQRIYTNLCNIRHRDIIFELIINKQQNIMKYLLINFYDYR